MLTAHNAKRYKGLSPTLHNCTESNFCTKHITQNPRNTRHFCFYVVHDALLPCPADRNGRHWTRMELSTILLKYRCTLVWQTWSRRGPVVQRAAA